MDVSVDRVISKDESKEADDILNTKTGEDITLIWYDQKIDIEIQTLMDNTNDCNYLCYTSEQLKEEVEKNVNEKIILIVSGQLAQETLSTFHGKDDIDSVYIFCKKSQQYQPLIDSKKYPKLVGIYTQYKELFDVIQKQLRILIKFRIFSQKPKAFRLLSNDSGGYLWYQLLKDFLFKMPVTETTEKEMLACCRYQYRSNPKQLEMIDEFEEIYASPQAITWYTRDSFLYRIVNRALRTQDIDALMQLRYIVTDLCALLKQTSDEQKAKRTNRTLYRGLRLSDIEIEQLKGNEGNLLATNGFLSTTPSLAVAVAFAANVIFEINMQGVPMKAVREKINLISRRHWLIRFSPALSDAPSIWKSSKTVSYFL
ncbi:unnamed protein product [Didymodactylos carnosus]|uniref:Uncharacterized protein n=1 Tax=Didymodactylos carnosus TaxID=1234261 RepID=A0A815GIF8_9BILA|nr:unnamed protein product [Didymodactylos carnosus]CAF4200580.1 unnamed protein product [Didymodactylos carnosus]